MNERIWSWFQQGKLREALRGDGEFFLPDVTFRTDHDRILLLGQLLDWAKERQREREAADAVQEVLEELSAEGDVVNSARLVLAYLVLVEQRGDALDLSLSDVAEILATTIAKNSDIVVNEEGTRLLVLSVAERLPELQHLLRLKDVRS